MLRHRISPAPSPHPTAISPSPQAKPPYTPSSSRMNPPSTSSQPSKLAVDLSPPLIAMIIIIATAFVIITYSRLLSRHLRRSYRRYTRWRRRRRRPPSSSAASSPPYPFDHMGAAFHVLSPYGLEESIIKTIPLSIYSSSRKSGGGGANSFRDCAVCLLEFEDDDYVRTLPVCSHEFHVDCIDIWLRSHANCPLCRAGIFTGDSPFTPLMAARIRPSLEDVIVDSITVLEPLTEIPSDYSESVVGIDDDDDEEDNNEITLIHSPRRSTANINHSQGTQSEDRYNRRDFLLKRSYSFSFERSLGSERSLVLEPATASPWRFRRGVGGSAAAAGGSSSSFWSKRLSPFSSLSKPRVFSFRYCRGIKYSPFQFRPRRNSVGSFLPLSESSVRLGSSRRAKSSFASPMFVSRLRSGDPEALLSPERLNRR